MSGDGDKDDYYLSIFSRVYTFKIILIIKEHVLSSQVKCNTNEVQREKKHWAVLLRFRFGEAFTAPGCVADTSF